MLTTIEIGTFEHGEKPYRLRVRKPEDKTKRLRRELDSTRHNLREANKRILELAPLQWQVVTRQEEIARLRAENTRLANLLERRARTRMSFDQLELFTAKG